MGGGGIKEGSGMLLLYFNESQNLLQYAQDKKQKIQEVSISSKGIIIT
mgnify:CR=1 FL=1